MTAEACTRCKRDAPIRIRDTLAFNVPYKLCGGCWDYYRSIDNENELAAFAEEMWRKAAAENVQTNRAAKQILRWEQVQVERSLKAIGTA